MREPSLLLVSAALLAACAPDVILAPAGSGAAAPGTGGAGGSLEGTGGAGGAGGALAPRGPVVLASGPSEPSSMAVDATHVYWTVDDQVLKVPLEGGSPVSLVSGSHLYPTEGIALDADHVYWISYYEGVFRVPKSGGPLVHIVSVSTSAANVAVDDDFVYMGEFGAEDVYGFAKIVKAPKTGGALTDVAEAIDGVDVIAIDADHVYWINSSRERVYKVSKAGGSPVELFRTGPLRHNEYSISTSDTDVLWASQQGIMKGPKSGGSTVLLHMTGQVHGMAVDSENVYWTQWGSDIAKGPLTGGEPTLIAEDQPSPWEIAVDATHVYWINYDGTVMKAPK
ncbi:hypothetical protein WMF37_29495 [Sorangium sp. So ce291]|uniref:hypothetical protein n=1 Tax=Sorangium sp. So ce291 TaxID=3133294 RepID=UPI003F6337AA